MTVPTSPHVMAASPSVAASCTILFDDANEPTNYECKRVEVDSGKFYCGHKGKYGLNMQTVCNARRRFVGISLRNPASASDYLAFITSDLKHDLATEGFRTGNLCIYGDNAYANNDFVAVPFNPNNLALTPGKRTVKR